MIKISENVKGSRATMKRIKRFKRASSRTLSTLDYDNYSNKYGLSSFRENIRFSLLIWRCRDNRKKVCSVTFNEQLLYFELYIEIKIKLSFRVFFDTILTFLNSLIQKMLLPSSFLSYIFFLKTISLENSLGDLSFVNYH